MRKLIRAGLGLLLLGMFALMILRPVLAWPATIYENPSQGINSNNSGSGAQQVKMAGTGSYPMGSVGGDGTSTLGRSGTAYTYTVPTYDWTTNEVQVQPEYYGRTGYTSAWQIVGPPGVGGVPGPFTDAHPTAKYAPFTTDTYSDLITGGTVTINSVSLVTASFGPSTATVYYQGNYGGPTGPVSWGDQNSLSDDTDDWGWSNAQTDFTSQLNAISGLPLKSRGCADGANGPYSGYQLCEAQVQAGIDSPFDSLNNVDGSWTITLHANFAIVDRWDHDVTIPAKATFYAIKNYGTLSASTLVLEDTSTTSNNINQYTNTHWVPYHTGSSEDVNFYTTQWNWAKEDITISGSNAAAVLAGGTIYFGIDMLITDNFWNQPCGVICALHSAWASISFTSTHCPVFKNSAWSQLLVVNQQLIQSHSYFLPGGQWSTLATDPNYGIPVVMQDSHGAIYQLGLTLTWAGDYWWTVDQFPSLIGTVTLDGIYPMPQATSGTYWHFTYGQGPYPKLGNAPTYTPNVPVVGEATVALNVTWANTGGYNYFEYELGLSFGAFNATFSTTYTVGSGTGTFTQLGQAFIDIYFTTLIFVNSLWISSATIDGTGATPQYIGPTSYSGDSPLYTVSLTIPSGDQHFVIGSQYSTQLILTYSFDLTDIPQLSNPSAPADGTYSEYQSMPFSVTVVDSSGIDKVFVAYNGTYANNTPTPDTLTTALTAQGSSLYAGSFTFLAGTYTMWFLAQDAAGNWATVGDYHLSFTAVFPQVTSDNGTNFTIVPFIYDEWWESLQFTVDGLGGSTWTLSLNGGPFSSGTWSGTATETFLVGSMAILPLGMSTFVFSANNTNWHTASLILYANVTSLVPIVTCLNGTGMINVDYNPRPGYNSKVSWSLEGYNPTTYQIQVTPQGSTPVNVESSTWASDEIMTWPDQGATWGGSPLLGLGHLPIGVYLLNLTATNELGYTGNASVLINVNNFAPNVVQLNGTSVALPANTFGTVGFFINSSTSGNISLFEDNFEIFHNYDWPPYYREIIGATWGVGVHNITLVVDNTNDHSLVTRVETDVIGYIAPTFASTPTDTPFNEYTGMQYIHFTVAGTGPATYTLIANGTQVYIGTWTPSVQASIPIDTASSTWGAGDPGTLYNCTLLVQNNYGQNVSKQFYIYVAAVFPQISLHPTVNYFVSDTGDKATITWNCADQHLDAYQLVIENTTQYGFIVNVTLAQGVFNGTSGTVSFDFAGLLPIGNYSVFMLVNNTHGRMTVDGIALEVSENPPSIQFDLPGTFLWVVIIGLFSVMLYMLKRSKSQLWVNKSKRNALITVGVIGIGVALTVLSLFGYAPVYSYNFAGLVAEWSTSLGVYGPLILVLVVAAVFVGGYFLLRYAFKRRT